MKHLVCENVLSYTINLWFWSQLQTWPSNLHPKPPPRLKMIPSSPCGPSCVSGGDYTADRAHSDATERQREKDIKKEGIRLLEKKKDGSAVGCVCARGASSQKADIPTRAAPLMSSLWDTPKLATWHRELRVTAGTTGKIHKHTHEKSTDIQRVLQSSQECENVPLQGHLADYCNCFSIK